MVNVDFLKTYEFDSEVLDVLIMGHSPIDNARGLTLRTVEDAARFIDAYGYDVENPVEKAELFGNFQESVSFIRRYFLYPDNPEGLKLDIPRKIAEMTDITQLLLLASQATGAGANVSPQQVLHSLWACAILKVMHTIAHIDKDLRSPYFLDIQTQILDRFYKFIFSDESGQVFLGKNVRDPNRVDLVSFESKPKKARDSVIVKLLHKPENVAEDIFDRVGIRFVTKNKLDALRVVKFLKDRYVVIPANVKPSRSRNTLIDTAKFSEGLASMIADLKAGKIAPGDFYARVSEMTETTALHGDVMVNPHSSKNYRALQFTIRQLIKIRNPLYDDLKAIKKVLQGPSAHDEAAKIAGRLDMSNIQKEIRFFYPFEVQIVDMQSHEENKLGHSSHSNYKKGQVLTALRRVMADLMRFSEKPPVVPENESS